jgi:type I site-specific restriction-modification system R (restriction) subunit
MHAKISEDAIEQLAIERLESATYLGFTGTPIEATDVNTPAVLGNYVDMTHL